MFWLFLVFGALMIGFACLRLLISDLECKVERIEKMVFANYNAAMDGWKNCIERNDRIIELAEETIALNKALIQEREEA